MDSPGDHAVADHGEMTADGYLAVDEAMSALEALSEDETLRLMAIERGFLSGTGFQRGQLYQEAVSRMLIGKRNCPRELPLVVFLIETMRSIASHSRKRVSTDKVRIVHDEVLDRLPASDLNPEQALLRQESEAGRVLQTIEDAFQDDEQAQMLLMGWDENLRGKELREALGMDQAELDYLVKRIRRKVRKMYPTGWQT